MAACDSCADLALILNSGGLGPSGGGGGGGSHHNRQLSILEFNAVEKQVSTWLSRYCSCCFNDIANFEKFNSLLQRILGKAIKLLETLIADIKRDKNDKNEGDDVSSKTEDNDDEDEDESKSWPLEDRQRLLQFVSKIFQPGFPLYLAYKRVSNCSTLEDLQQQEAAALGNYCEMSDSDMPVFLMRNVCFWIDSRGPQAILGCFRDALDKEEQSATNQLCKQPPPSSSSNAPSSSSSSSRFGDILPVPYAHILVQIISYVRNLINFSTAQSVVAPLRTLLIRYMCRLSDEELRIAGNRSMTELVWHTVKEVPESHHHHHHHHHHGRNAAVSGVGVFSTAAAVSSISPSDSFDPESLELALKYLTCSTLTLRIGGLAQINGIISAINDACCPQHEFHMGHAQYGSCGGAGGIGGCAASRLADWLVQNRLVEHMFGPNLHVELIKQGTRWLDSAIWPELTICPALLLYQWTVCSGQWRLSLTVPHP